MHLLSLVALCAAFVAPINVVHLNSPYLWTGGLTLMSVVLKATACATGCNCAILFWCAWNGAVMDHFYTTNTTKMTRAIRTFGYDLEGYTGLIFLM